MEGWKIVELTALVREGDADELHAAYGRMNEYDESQGGYVVTRDLTNEDEEAFGAIIDDWTEE